MLPLTGSIYVKTIDPEGLRDKMLPRLRQLRDEGRIAPTPPRH